MRRPTALALGFWNDYRILAVAWLIAVTAVNAYRAATLCFTNDEAFNFNLFIAHPEALFRSYDACYHVLHTWLTFLTSEALGRAEWALRLPALIAGCVYLAAVYRLSHYLFGNGVRLLIATVLLSANPLILDHLSMARGYGLALAFLAWACYHVIRWMAEPAGDWRLPAASVLLGLSVASNLTFLVPAVAIGVVAAAAPWIHVGPPVRARDWLHQIFQRLWIPGIVTGFLIVVIPLANAGKVYFYWGTNDFAVSVDTLVGPSFARAWNPHPEWVWYLVYAGVPLLAIVLGVAWAGAVRRLRAGSDQNAPAYALFLTAGALAISVAILVGAHWILGVRYPAYRTGLYLIWLSLAALLIAAQRSRRIALTVVCALMAIVFVAEIDNRYYFEFRYNAEMRTMFRKIRELHGQTPVKLAGDEAYRQSLEYYRTRWKAGWISDLEQSWRDHDADYYLLVNDSELQSTSLRIVWKGPVTGILLAQKKGAR